MRLRNTRGLAVCGMLAALVWAAGCSRQAEPKGPAGRPAPVSIHLSSTAFAEGAPIPATHTCDGPDVSPPLRWSGVPTGARSLALVVDDPDAPAGTWVHWVLYSLAPTVSELPEGQPKTDTLPNGARQGKNDFGKIGYGGPCPPKGGPHHYHFKLYALDAEPQLKPGGTRKDLDATMQGHVLAQGELIGTYQKR